MTVCLRQGSVTTQIGPGGVLHSLFSTVAVRLENGTWGSRFPVVMGNLYSGQLAVADADRALGEMQIIQRELRALSPSLVVWDAEDTSIVPPWGTPFGAHVRSCADYWVTINGRNLVAELVDNLESLKEFGGTLDVISE